VKVLKTFTLKLKVVNFLRIDNIQILNSKHLMSLQPNKRKASTDLNSEFKKQKLNPEVSLLNLYKRKNIASDGNCLFRAI